MANLPKYSSRSGVLAAGNWIIDHVKMIDTWPAQDALATITDQSKGNGGGPYNLLKDLARMRCGFPLAGVGLVGCDADGEDILRDCDAHQIDRAGFHQTAAAPTSYTDVMTVSETGRRTFFHRHGTNALLAAEHFNLAASSARVFYLGYLCLLRKLDEIAADGRTSASRIFETAQKSGMITVADLVSSQNNRFQDIVNPSLPYLDLLLLNEFELARLVGRVSEAGHVAELVADAKALLSRGVRCAIIVHQPEFALAVGADGTVCVEPSVRVPQDLIRGTVGAGDAFAAGVIFGLHERWEMRACLELGVCVAAVSLLDATSSAAVRPLQDCLKWGREMGFRPAPK